MAWMPLCLKVTFDVANCSVDNVLAWTWLEGFLDCSFLGFLTERDHVTTNWQFHLVVARTWVEV